MLEFFTKTEFLRPFPLKTYIRVSYKPNVRRVQTPEPFCLKKLTPSLHFDGLNLTLRQSLGFILTNQLLSLPLYVYL
jgi:hypothetical protein